MYTLKYIREHKKTLSLIVVIFIVFLIVRSDRVKGALEQLSPPQLPELQVKTAHGEWLPQEWLEQNWGNKTNDPSRATKKYHHLSQGTRTLPLPYNWFINIEQASSSVLLMPFTSENKFIDNDYLLRLGFIRSDKDPVHNPDGLPIGFARTFSQNIAGISGQTDTIGFTCAGCHTSHFIYGDSLHGGVEYIIEGGPATTDLGLLTNSLTAAVGQLLVSAKVPFLGARFDRFAKNVLGTEYSASTKLRLSNELTIFAKAQLGGLPDKIEVTEGFTRLDALNRIGNALFAQNIDRPQNNAAINAPVNYPHLWTTSWFDWVQYDASVMGPLIRNVGEALGVKAFLDVKSSEDDNRFSSSIPIGNLVWIENLLAGPQPTKERGFEGLKAPKWKLNVVNQTLALQGKSIYEERCEGCHLPSIKSEKIWNGNKFIAPIVWYENNKKHETDNVLKLNVIPLEEIGTDRRQAKVMLNRTMDTSGDNNGSLAEARTAMQIDTQVCVRDFNSATEDQLSLIDSTTGETVESYKKIALTERWIRDGANVSFGYALAAAVDKTIDAWFKVNGLSNRNLQDRIKEGRPNCIQAGMGYKARPLNGVWATAPFLHNGSVATLRDLLCPVEGKRPEFIQLGSIIYDIKNMGILQPEGYEKIASKHVSNGESYDEQGFFILNSNLEGNLNTGHQFDDSYDENNYTPGVIGPKLETQQCEALLEYLKII